MHDFRIPPSHAWYSQPVCTPDRGLLYIAGNHGCIGYIPPLNNANSSVRMVDLRFRCKAVVSDTTWDAGTRWFITLNEDNAVSVWDLDTASIVRGHRAHCINKQSNAGNGHGSDTFFQTDRAICITGDRKVLTIDSHRFVSYCLRSNTYSLFKDDFITKRHRVNILKSSPYAENIIAVGYKSGLVVIADVKAKTILHTLRGHDTDVVSMEWMVVNAHDFIEKENNSDFRRQSNYSSSCSSPAFNETDLPHRNTTTIAEIHSRPHSETSNEEINQGTCQTLNEEKKAESVPAKDNSSSLLQDSLIDDSKQSQAEFNEISSYKPMQLSDKTSTEITSAEEPSEVLLNDEQNDSELTSIANGINGVQKKYYLATGAQESFVYIWDTEMGKIAHKVNLKNHGKSTIPKPECALLWLSPTEIIINNPNGTISRWKIKIDPLNKEKCVEQNSQFSERGVIAICGSSDPHMRNTYIWTFSIHSQIIGRIYFDGDVSVMGNYGTLPIGMYAIRECPHDLNKVAIAGNNKRIGLVDTLTLNKHNIGIQWLISKVQSKVLALAWHPTRENVLSYSTVEGRIGVFDITKPANPSIMDKFCGKQVYRIAYGVSDDNCQLFACNFKNITTFSDLNNKSSKYDHKEFSTAISSISTCENYLSIGTADGVFKLLTLDFKEIFEKRLSKKYISEIAWHCKTKRHVAVSASDGSINLFECVTDENGSIRVEDRGHLDGHKQGVTWVKWSNESENRLVSTAFDNTVRVWNTETKECIALAEYGDKMFCAIFLPSDENFVACSGKSETLHIFDIREKKFNESSHSGDSKIKRNKTEVTWGVEKENEDSERAPFQQQTIPQRQRNNEEVNVKDLQNNGIENSSRQLVERAKPKCSTIFHISNKEINRSSMNCLLDLINNKIEDLPSDKHKRISYLISKITTREEIKFVLDKELENTNASASGNVGHILIPQINNNLREEILAKVEAKQLTELHVSLAPSISFEFWKKCCLAYAFQCIEKGFVLEATPYLLAVYQITEAINALCDKHYYREAWFIAKMRREAEDRKVFYTISSKWINHLEYLGNFEAAALIAYLVDKKNLAVEILSKRKTLTPEISEAIRLIQESNTFKS